MIAGSSTDGILGHAKKKRYTLKLPSAYSDMAGEEMDYCGGTPSCPGFWARASVASFIIGGTAWAIDCIPGVNKEALGAVAVAFCISGTVALAFSAAGCFNLYDTRFDFCEYPSYHKAFIWIPEGFHFSRI